MKKIIMIVALVLIVLGAAITALAFAVGGKLEEYQKVTHEAEGAYTSINAKTSIAGIVIKKSENGKTYAVCSETEKLTYSLAVENDILILSEQDNRRWYDNIGISVGEGICTLYLPEGAYNKLYAETSSGKIDCTEADMRYQSAALITSSGKIKGTLTVSGELQVKSSSGRIEMERCAANTVSVSSSSGVVSLESLTAGASMEVRASSGKIEISDVSAQMLTVGSSSGAIEIEALTACVSLSVTSTSGRIEIADAVPQVLTASASSGAIDMEDVTASVRIDADTTSGSITLERCDAGALALQSSSGRISGSLLSGKLFDASSDSGHIDCPPPSEGGGLCRIKTVSGAISIQVVS